MQYFNDKTGRRWTIDFTVGCIARVKAASDGKFNLWDSSSDCSGKPLAQTLDSDLSELWELLWYIVENEAGKIAVTAEMFGESMTPDCLIHARAALWKEWTDFFRQLQRPDAAAMLEKIDKFHRIAMEAVIKNLESEQLKQAENRVEQAICTRLRLNAGELEGKLESTLETILTGNSIS